MDTADLALAIALLALRDADAFVVEDAAKLADQAGRADLARALRDMVAAREV